MNLATEVNPDLWAAVRRSYESQAWSNAILDAVHHFSDVIRAKSGLQSDGTALAGQAFGGKEPKIRLNRLATESEKNVQAGVEQIARGLYQAIRNPRSHERFEDSQRECDAIIVFVDYLLGMIGHARAAFSIDNILERVTDDNFVANKRYAELILAEIPKSKRLDTLVTAFEGRNTSDSLKQVHFFQVCISSLETNEKEKFFEVVSSHLQSSTDERELRSVFQILDVTQWPFIAEADRMRSENRVIRSIEAGRYSSAKERCVGGALATWAKEFFKNFSLKRELLHSLYAALSSGVREREDYVFKFFFRYLDDLADVPPAYFMRHIRERLEQGDERYKEALGDYLLFGPESWVAPFKKQLDEFRASETPAPFDFDDDDIPF
ncbi:TIGR02391 family protein [Xanthomonas arboricola]|uniref:TIGR02391 family protein n=1 Tax=Xanthomonas arboricola TaxID=56448 RepID=UPI000CEE9311|nr:TIGR02391 family protein [Xanthomonas arboricola]PPT63490.1 TIGR02391 family protein [Xanthomonas arboricola]